MRLARFRIVEQKVTDSLIGFTSPASYVALFLEQPGPKAGRVAYAHEIAKTENGAGLVS